MYNRGMCLLKKKNQPRCRTAGNKIMVGGGGGFSPVALIVPPEPPHVAKISLLFLHV